MMRLDKIASVVKMNDLRMFNSFLLYDHLLSSNRMAKLG